MNENTKLNYPKFQINKTNDKSNVIYIYLTYKTSKLCPVNRLYNASNA